MYGTGERRMIGRTEPVKTIDIVRFLESVGDVGNHYLEQRVTSPTREIYTSRGDNTGSGNKEERGGRQEEGDGEDLSIK